MRIDYMRKGEVVRLELNRSTDPNIMLEHKRVVAAISEHYGIDTIVIYPPSLKYQPSLHRAMTVLTIAREVLGYYALTHAHENETAVIDTITLACEVLRDKLKMRGGQHE